MAVDSKYKFMDNNSQIENLRNEITEKRNQLIELLKKDTAQDIEDYELKNINGEPVRLSELFQGQDRLMVIHNMGKSCVYCTLWADGFNGLVKHFEDRLPTVLISPDPPEVQKQFANGRGWNFKIYSAHKSPFLDKVGFMHESGRSNPGVSIYVKEDGKIRQHSKDFFGPGDFYSPIWHMFDLIPEGQKNWAPKYSYEE